MDYYNKHKEVLSQDELNNQIVSIVSLLNKSSEF
jgi:hypothetical protein